MPLTKDFRETVRDRAQRDAAFRRALLKEAVEQLVANDVETGQSLVRNYIKSDVEEIASRKGNFRG